MIAIETRYIGPTDYRGSRYVATTCNGHRLTVGANYGLTPEQNARAVALALCKKMGWRGDLACGSTKRGWVFVFTS